MDRLYASCLTQCRGILHPHPGTAHDFDTAAGTLHQSIAHAFPGSRLEIEGDAGRFSLSGIAGRWN